MSNLLLILALLTSLHAAEPADPPIPDDLGCITDTECGGGPYEGNES